MGRLILRCLEKDPAGRFQTSEELLAELAYAFGVINPYADERYMHVPNNFPVVFVGARSHDEEVCSISLDDEKAAYEATRHLTSLGHHHIAVVNGTMAEDCSQDRLEGYRRALDEAGISFDESLVFEGDWSASSGRDALLDFIKKDNQPTAIFAQNDRMAMGVMRAARDVNLHVPDKLSVIGVDDMPLSSYFDPPLTTMRSGYAPHRAGSHPEVDGNSSEQIG